MNVSIVVKITISILIILDIVLIYKIFKYRNSSDSKIKNDNSIFIRNWIHILPYISIFGMTWSIMNSFRFIAATTPNTILALLVQGIAEALLSVLIGLGSFIILYTLFNFFYFPQNYLFKY